ENNPYVKTTKESIQITEEQDEHMLASSYSSDAEEEMSLDPETECPNNASSDNKATYEAQEIEPISTTATYCLLEKSLEEIPFTTEQRALEVICQLETAPKTFES
ncbi:10610_t:CDS:2, partial [Cetraspora pellucida]